MTFRIELAGTGDSFDAAPGETVLEAALRHGRNLPYGCRSGGCGSCRGQILEGSIDYAGAAAPALSEQERKAGMALLCLARPQSDLRIAVRQVDRPAEITVRNLPVRVARMERMAEDVMGLWLALPATERLQFLAGQYVEVLTADGKPRPFSLANAPHHDELLELHVRRYPGGKFSERVFSSMREGTLLRIRGPFGDFYFRESSDRPVLLIAGGTGFAPIKALVEHAIALGITRPISLYWGARHRDGLYRDALALEWAARHRQIRYVPVLSEARPEDVWTGRTGLVHLVVAGDYEDFEPVEVYASGPPAMVYAARAALIERGLDPEHFHSDAFEPAAG